MESQFSTELLASIEECGVVAVLVIDDVRHAVPVAESLLAGGIDMIELTLRTPVAIDAAKEITRQVPGLTIGIGTVITIEQVDQIVDAGVSFAVAPGLNPRVVQHAQQRGLPFSPGVVTPSDIELAVELGCRELKFFPAETSGGMPHLRSMAAPYRHLGLRFIPLGGLTAANMADYLSDPLVAAIGGSWIAPRPVIAAEDWKQITLNAREAREIVLGLRCGESE